MNVSGFCRASEEGDFRYQPLFTKWSRLPLDIKLMFALTANLCNDSSTLHQLRHWKQKATHAAKDDGGGGGRGATGRGILLSLNSAWPPRAT